MPKSWTLTATSRTGDKVNQITGSSTDSVAVYSKADLDQRIAAAQTDPRNLTVTVREGK